MSLFTVFCEYKGGTYIRQVRAPSASVAVEEWLADLRPGDIRGISTKTRESMLASITDKSSMPVVPISACDGVWCWSANNVLIHLVNTYDPARGRRSRDHRRRIEVAEDRQDLLAVRRARRESKRVLIRVHPR